jgi:hypothetical protein
MQRVIFVFLLVFAAAFPLAAQVLYGSLTGNVHDAASAVVPGASVKLRNLGTAQEFTEQTNGAGSYTFSNLSTGSYDLTIGTNGFRALTQRGIAITWRWASSAKASR